MPADTDAVKPAILRRAEEALRRAARAYAHAQDPEYLDECEEALRRAATEYEKVRRAVAPES